jgi:predicted nucleic acid-binding protein
LQRIFIDSSVFVANFFEEKLAQGQAAKDLLGRVAQGRYEGIIYPFIVFEVLTSGRRILTERTNLSKDEIEKSVANATGSIARIPNLTVISDYSKDIDGNKIAEMATSYLKRYPGEIIPCKKDDKRPYGRTHKGLYGCDLIHLAVAVYCKCQAFVTLDKGFKNTNEGIDIRLLN